MCNPSIEVGHDDQEESLVLALNAGSSSLKFAVFRGRTEPVRLYSGVFDRIGGAESTFTLKLAGNQEAEHKTVLAKTHASCLVFLLIQLEELIGKASFRVTVHRIVHGGPHFATPQIVTPKLLSELQRFRPFAPEHLPAEIGLVDEMLQRWPHSIQMVCFDTAFHQDLPFVARCLPIPRRYQEMGVRRYGFHGLSYEFLIQELARHAGAQVAMGRVILAHLGNGASLAAVSQGKSIDTSMGFTPAAGLVMGCRSGDVDPGLVAYLARSEGLTAQKFDELVNQQSGMLGVSETSADMRELLAQEGSDPRAAEAISLFCYQAKKWIGSFAAVLGGLDTLVFSGGIGENCESIRTRICASLGFLGVELNETNNSQHATLISADGSKVALYVIRTDEELLMARSAVKLLRVAGPTA